MKKVQAIEWSFIRDGRIIPKGQEAAVILRSSSMATVALITSKAVAVAAAAAKGAATSNSTWMKFFEGVLGAADWVCVGIIIFSGLNWMFANRSKAMEYLIGGSAGYLLIRKSKLIQEWLETL